MKDRKKPQATRSSGAEVPTADRPESAGTLFARTFAPVVEEFNLLKELRGRASPEELLARFTEAYVVLYSLGQFGDIVFDRLLEFLPEADRIEAKATSQLVADEMFERFADRIFGPEETPRAVRIVREES